MHDVSDVAETDGLKLTEHGAQDQSDRHEHGTGASEELPLAQTEGTSAEGALLHLDLLA
jgi:hypothetical protein